MSYTVFYSWHGHTVLVLASVRMLDCCLDGSLNLSYHIGLDKTCPACAFGYDLIGHVLLLQAELALGLRLHC